MPKKIALLEGGMSSEREVSLNTSKAFQKALTKLGHNFVVIDAGPDLPKRLMEEKPDLVLSALHGKYAEDGTVQGLCEYLKIPYSGSGVLAAALTMDKLRTKQVLRQAGVPTPDFQVFNTKKQKIKAKDIEIKLPFVVKPIREGSSVGITVCKNQEQVQPALDLAMKHDWKVMVEAFVTGKEITVPVLQGKALTPIEIAPKTGLYDYKSKYTKGATEYIMPPTASAPAVKKLQEIAEQIFTELDMRAYCRIDFMIDTKEKPYMIEVNSLPGCTETSLVPKAAAHDGIPFEKVIQILIDEATLDYEGVR
jgi:D-alanine-D-alanine ligase